MCNVVEAYDMHRMSKLKVIGSAKRIMANSVLLVLAVFAPTCLEHHAEYKSIYD